MTFNPIIVPTTVLTSAPRSVCPECGKPERIIEVCAHCGYHYPQVITEKHLDKIVIERNDGSIIEIPVSRFLDWIEKSVLCNERR